MDSDGKAISGAQVTLTTGQPPAKVQAISDDEGNFSLSGVLIGPFQILVTGAPFTSRTYSGVLAQGQDYIVPAIVMTLPAVNTVVHVYPRKIEAAHEVKAEEKQRVLGLVPNYYVVYAERPVPLDFKQKAELAWKSSTDPITIAGVAVLAGSEQAANWSSGYGQGAQGFGKRFGATYGNIFISTFLGSAVFPAVLRQDPRYFYRGTGSWKSRLWYAVDRAVITRGDNGRWQPNYSSFLGNLAAAGIGTTYSASKEHGVGTIFETVGIRTGEGIFANVFEEFFSRRLTPMLSRHEKPQSGAERQSAD